MTDSKEATMGEQQEVLRSAALERALRQIRSEAYYGLERQTESGVLLTIEGIARRALGLPMAPWKLNADVPGQPGEEGQGQ
jgi:hypothetical protein